MDYCLERRENAVVVIVQGRVDESSWEAFGAGLRGAIGEARQSGIGKVIIDLGKLDYMSSRGLRVLTVARRESDEADIELLLASPNEVMREILAISRYDKLFKVTETVDAAL